MSNTLRSHIKIVGLDNSLTGTGVCVVKLGARGEEPQTSTNLIAPDTYGVERLIYIREEIKAICKDADMVVIENYAFSKGDKAHQIGELGGVLRVMLTEAGIKWIEVAPSAVKKFATGKGMAKKEAMAVAAYKRWGKEFTTNDECDAFILGMVGRALVEIEFDGEVPGWLTAFQKEVVAVLRGEKIVKAKKEKSKKGKGE